MADRRGYRPYTPQQNQRQPNQQNINSKKKNFEPYWQQQRIGEAIRRGEAIEGTIIVKNFLVAYVPSPDETRDILIFGPSERNRALDGDLVVVQTDPLAKWRVCVEDYQQYKKTLHPANVGGVPRRPQVGAEGDSINTLNTASQISPRSQTSQQVPEQAQDSAGADAASSSKKTYKTVEEILADGSPADQLFFRGNLGDYYFVQKTGKVVAITERRHSRMTIGHLQASPNNQRWANLEPCDSRMPRIGIPAASCPNGFWAKPSLFSKRLYIAQITSWGERPVPPDGKIVRQFGTSGELPTENEAIIWLSNVEDLPFSEEVEQCLPPPTWKIPESEVAKRTDLRKLCVFSIDPENSKDLDDALSIESLGAGLYQVGVHVADVGFFVKEGTALDRVAFNRSSSVNLVQKVIPMLPPVLSEDLCSLHAGRDRLAVSIFWTMDELGQVRDVRFDRTVIQSCVTLTYEDAQDLIQTPARDVNCATPPQVTNSFRLSDVKERLCLLNKIAQNLKKKRMNNGALVMDTNELKFNFDERAERPIDCFLAKYQDSNRLVREFMVLANTAVASRIEEIFPGRALLRQQGPPPAEKIQDLVKFLTDLGLNINASPSSQDIQSLLTQYAGKGQHSQFIEQALMEKILRVTQGSKYIVSGTCAPEDLRHYSLNVSLNTTFTSPIRRYPDLLVHRLLAASLDQSSATSFINQKIADLQKIADTCNDKIKIINKLQRDNEKFYLSLLLQKYSQCQEQDKLDEPGVVMSINSTDLDVYIFKFNTTVKVARDENLKTLHSISVFSLVTCSLDVKEEAQRCSCKTRKLTGVIKQVIGQLNK